MIAILWPLLVVPMLLTLTISIVLWLIDAFDHAMKG